MQFVVGSKKIKIKLRELSHISRCSDLVTLPHRTARNNWSTSSDEENRAVRSSTRSTNRLVIQQRRFVTQLLGMR